MKIFYTFAPVLLFGLAAAVAGASAQSARDTAPIDEDEIKALFPLSLLNVPRSKISAAQAIEATYEPDPGSSARARCRQFLQVRITDLGSLTPMLTTTAGAIDEESRTGYKKTIYLDRDKQFMGTESWDGPSGRSELELQLAGFAVGFDATCFGAGGAVKAAKEMRSGLSRLIALRGNPAAQ